MRLIKKLAGSILILAIPALIISGCKKDKEDPDTDTSSAVDNAFAQSTYDDVGTMSDQAVLSGGLSSFKGTGDETIMMSPCATVTFDTVSNPRTVTINFGTSNCLCNDGRYRRGIILISYNGAYRDSGSSHTITFNNYYVNDYKVEGNKTVTNKGLNSSGNIWFAISVNGTITSPGGATLTWQSTRQREWIAGSSTLLWSDDVYRITGSASGTAFSGTTFSANITNPLIVALDCRWIKDGVLEFTPSGKLTRVINYGYLNGNCDRLAQVTIGSNTYIIELR